MSWPLSLAEGLALARSASLPWPGSLPPAVDSPPLFERIGLEARMDVDVPESIDVTGAIGLTERAARASTFWETSTAQGVPDLLGEVVSGHLRGRVRAAYVELEPPARGLPQRASVFVTLDETRSPEEQRADVRAIVAALLAREDHARDASLERALRMLPPSARAWQVGWMLGREHCETRICALGTAAALSSWARSLGWPRDGLQDVIETLRGPDCTASLHVSTQLGEVGIELAPAPGLAPRESRTSWRALLDRLAEHGHVRRSTIARFCDWPGEHTIVVARSDVAMQCLRRASHVKVVLSNSGADRCKGYVTVAARPVRGHGSSRSSQVDGSGMP